MLWHTIQIDRLLETIVRRGASDLHLAVGRPPTLRLHGHLRELQTKVLEPEDTIALMKSITPERIQQEYRRRRARATSASPTAKRRASASRSSSRRAYCSLVLRKIPNKILTFEQIGLPKMAEQICRRPRGIFLVTGPTGSGKTTTLACDDQLHQRELRPAHHHDGRPDRVLPPRTRSRSWCSAKSAWTCRTSPKRCAVRLRQDPDVMLVGEMRDLATIGAAITAAETGHLVFGTLHTSGAASTINRIIDAFPTDQQEQVRVQLANNLIAVLSQALCPRVDTTAWSPAYEFMYVTPRIQNLIRENKSFRIDSEIQTGKRYGMQLLDDNLWMHFQAGRISAEEAIDKSKNPGGMVDRMQRRGYRRRTIQDDALLRRSRRRRRRQARRPAAAAVPGAGGGNERRQADARPARCWRARAQIAERSAQTH